MTRRKVKKAIEERVRLIVRQELSGINASIQSDPIYTATSLIENLDILLSQPDADVNLKEVRHRVMTLKNTLPEIMEEINIIRDTFIDE